ncbi:MAG TPA: tetratricopeptide repeat protein, partial [Gemmataceae bacterium]
AHNNLGLTLHEKGQLDEAIAEYREAIRLNKDYAEAHNNLGLALTDKGQLDEAIVAFREAIRLKKDFPEAHYSFGVVLGIKGRLDEAIAEYREAIRLKNNYAEAHCNLGDVLEKKGLYAEALIHRRRGHELGSKNPRWPNPSAQWVQNCERLVKLDKKLPVILSGQEQPTDFIERLTLAVMCQQHKKRYAAATRFYGEAFADEPKLIEDQATGLRYNAACAAALAGCGQGIDADKLDSKERTRLRRQALDWLRSDLTLWGQLREKGPAKARPIVAQTMQHWLKDSDFAGVRGADALDHLSESERRDWRQLWRDVEALGKRAASAASPGIKEPNSTKESLKPKP